MLIWLKKKKKKKVQTGVRSWIFQYFFSSTFIETGCEHLSKIYFMDIWDWKIKTNKRARFLCNVAVRLDKRQDSCTLKGHGHSDFLIRTVEGNQSSLERKKEVLDCTECTSKIRAHYLPLTFFKEPLSILCIFLFLL